MVKKFFSLVLLFGLASVASTFASSKANNASSSAASSAAMPASKSPSVPAASASTESSWAVVRMCKNACSTSWGWMMRHPIASSLMAASVVTCAACNNNTVRGWFGMSNDDCKFCSEQCTPDKECGCGKTKTEHLDA